MQGNYPQRVQIAFKRIGYTAAARVLDTHLSRAKGLMFSQSVPEPLLFTFPTTDSRTNSIHSFFCPPFDAAFISPGGRVVDYFPNIQPNILLITPTGPSSMLIEAAPNSLKGLKRGDLLTIGHINPQRPLLARSAQKAQTPQEELKPHAR